MFARLLRSAQACAVQGRTHAGRLLFGLLLLGYASACSTVAPYERERLAKQDMRLNRNADARAGAEHATAYREGTSGAVGSSGGGCGCN
jgi:hypothetical protein